MDYVIRWYDYLITLPISISAAKLHGDEKYNLVVPQIPEMNSNGDNDEKQNKEDQNNALKYAQEEMEKRWTNKHYAKITNWTILFTFASNYLTLPMECGKILCLVFQLSLKS